MAENLIEKITKKQLNPNVPEFRVGYTVTVGCKIKDFRNGKEVSRIQDFEGVVISRKGEGVSETFTVRKGKVRRAKLYFLRERKSQYKIKEQR